MQFYLMLMTRSKLHSLSSVAWRCVAWRQCQGYQYCGGVPAALVAWAYISLWGAFPGRLRAVLPVSRSFAYQVCTCTCPRGVGLAQHSVWWRSCAFQYFPSLLSLFRGVGAFPQQFFPLNSLFSVTGASFGVWGGGRSSWLGCRQGRLMGCSTDLGLGCWFQYPDPPFVTQALTGIFKSM